MKYKINFNQLLSKIIDRFLHRLGASGEHVLSARFRKTFRSTEQVPLEHIHFRRQIGRMLLGGLYPLRQHTHPIGMADADNFVQCPLRTRRVHTLTEFTVKLHKRRANIRKQYSQPFAANDIIERQCEPTRAAILSDGFQLGRGFKP